MHLPPLISDLALILGVAALVTYLFRLIRQPVVLGYLVAGFLLSPYTSRFTVVSDLPNVQVLAELGIIFLMFTLGLEFSFRRLSRVGPTVALAGIFELAAMFGLGYFVAGALGWGRLDALFLGGIVAISSTTIIMKTLTDMGLQNRRFAEHVMGVLIVEDIAAVLLLVLLGTVGRRESLDIADLFAAFGQLMFVAGTWFIVGYFLIPRLVKIFGRLGNDEMLVILAVGLCLSLARLATSFEYSAALGAFIMGSILAETTDSERIAKLIRPVRDIFGAVFFVSIGMLVNVNALTQEWMLVLIFASVVIAGKILSLTLGSLMSGQSLRVSVQAGFTMAQIGEFSFIIASLGTGMGVIKPSLYPVIVSVSVLTTFTTPYLVRISESVARRLDPESAQRLPFGAHKFVSTAGETEEALPRRMISWIASGILLTLIFESVAFGMAALPTTASETATLWIPSIAWLLAVTACSPFLWAMWSAFGQFGGPIDRKMLVAASRALTLLWLAIVSSKIVVNDIRLLVAVGAAVGIYLGFHRYLEQSYRWFERQFVAPFIEKDHGGSGHSAAFAHLAPWDARLTTIEIVAESKAVGQTIEQMKLRERFGFNIVAIRRGDRNIVAPTRNELVMPGDRLLGLGTDTQIDSVRSLLSEVAEGRENQTFEYELRRIHINAASPLDGRSILESGIRERYEGLVVGIEREAQRMMNPGPTHRIRPNDVLLVVGERAQLRALQKLAEAVESR